MEWMTILGRLSTKDRLALWGITIEDVCVLCGMAQESHSHMFFLCPFSASVWAHFLEQNGTHRSVLDLHAELDWCVQHRGGSSFNHSVFKLSLAVVVYHLWCERNRRVFQRQALVSVALIARVLSDLRACIVSWRHHFVLPFLASSSSCFF